MKRLKLPKNNAKEYFVAEDRKEYSNNRSHDEKRTDLGKDYYDDSVDDLKNKRIFPFM